MNLTIIVPVYNAQQYLRDCLDSIRRQSYRDWTCIIVNDGSTDGSQNIIDYYCSIDKRFISIIKKNEKSAAKARAYAMAQVVSEWVTFVDADDAISSDSIERLVARQLETNADFVMGIRVGCSIDLKEELWRIPSAKFDRSQILSGKEACLLTLGGWQIGGIAIYRRSLDDGLVAGPYMNSDEYLERQRLMRAQKVAFADAYYYFRKNVGTSDMISVRMFDRTMVDMQLERFVLHNFPDREDKIKALTWQRLFNLLYLEADYRLHKSLFSQEECEHICKILKMSYNAIHRWRMIKYVPTHAWITFLPYPIYGALAECYVRYKRKKGGNFYYR